MCFAVMTGLFQNTVETGDYTEHGPLFYDSSDIFLKPRLIVYEIYNG